MNNVQSLVSYGDKIQIGALDMDNNLIPMPKFETEEVDPENQSLKSFLAVGLIAVHLSTLGLQFPYYTSTRDSFGFTYPTTSPLIGSRLKMLAFLSLTYIFRVSHAPVT